MFTSSIVFCFLLTHKENEILQLQRFDRLSFNSSNSTISSPVAEIFVFQNSFSTQDCFLQVRKNLQLQCNNVSTTATMPFPVGKLEAKTSKLISASLRPCAV